jgi:hypothetical protein
VSLDKLSEVWCAQSRVRFGLPVALEGRWTGASTFTFDYGEVANVNAFVCRFVFEGQAALIDVTERSGELEINIRATRVG